MGLDQKSLDRGQKFGIISANRFISNVNGSYGALQINVIPKARIQMLFKPAAEIEGFPNVKEHVPTVNRMVSIYLIDPSFVVEFWKIAQ